MSQETGPSCPYAAQFSGVAKVPSIDSTEEEHSDHESTSKGITESIARCPAFSKAKGGVNVNDPSLSCPFRNATSQRDIQKIMMQIPPSHVSSDSVTASQFKRALEVMHDVSHSQQPEQYKMVISDCPFKTFYENSGEAFVEVMESLSFAAIMTDMADIVTVDEASKAGKQDISRLSTKLKQGTAKSHRAAENVSFVRNFIKGNIDRDLYVQLVANLYFVYDMLENELEKHAPKVFPSLHQPLKLNRTESLKNDLNFFLGSEWNTKIAPSLATKEYVERIRSIADANPILLIAHAYTRYLGDLSGGKVLQRVAKKALGLKVSDNGSVEGLQFYEFPMIPEGAKAFKNHYRLTLDNMKLSSWQTNRLVSEANVAFVLNMRIFEELDCAANVEGASVRPLSDALSYLVDFDTQEPDGEEKCPFGFVGPNPHKKVTLQPKQNLDNGGSRCPWPFIFFHDPAQGLRDWQTSVVAGIILCYLYSVLLDSS